MNVHEVGQTPAHPLSFASIDPIDLVSAGYEIRRENDQQFRALVADLVIAEQAAEHRNVSQIGNSTGIFFLVFRN